MKDHLNRNVQNIYIAQLIESTSIINTEMNRFYDYSESEKKHSEYPSTFKFTACILNYDTNL